MNLLNPGNGFGAEIWSHYDASSAMPLDEVVTSIAEDYEPVYDVDILQSSAIENPNISEFESIYGLYLRELVVAL